MKVRMRTSSSSMAWIERPVRELREQQPLAQSKLVMGPRVRPELLPGSAAHHC